MITSVTMKQLATAVLVLLLSGSATPSRGQVYFHNNTADRVKIAYGLEDFSKGPYGKRKYIVTFGWYWADPGERIMLNENIGNYHVFYFYVETADGRKLSKDAIRLLVDPDQPFSVLNTTQETNPVIKKLHPDYVWKSFEFRLFPNGRGTTEYTHEFPRL